MVEGVSAMRGIWNDKENFASVEMLEFTLKRVPAQAKA
jgi:hypothetical protein